MYILLHNNSYSIIKDKTELSYKIDKSLSTINRHLKNSSRWQVGDFLVIIPDYIQEKSKRGGKRH